MATLLPNGKQAFFDSNGNPLVGGSVGFFIPGTSTPKNSWQDAAQTILNTNPVILDGAGAAVIYGSGVYRQIVKDALGNLIWDQATASYPDPQSLLLPCSAAGGNSLVLTPLPGLQPDGLVAYLNYLMPVFVAAQTNTGAVTAQLASFAALDVYLDKAAGPALLTGGEITAGNLYFLSFDGALDGGAGGWHLNGLGALGDLESKITTLSTGITTITNEIAAIQADLALLGAMTWVNSSGTYTTPATSTTSTKYRLGLTGGGGGGGAYNSPGGAGGAAGSTGFVTVLGLPPNTPIIFTIGAGGGIGQAGGTSSIQIGGTTYAVYGGNAAVGSAPGSVIGPPFGSGPWDEIIVGGDGSADAVGTAASGFGTGGVSYWGGSGARHRAGQAPGSGGPPQGNTADPGPGGTGQNGIGFVEIVS